MSNDFIRALPRHHKDGPGRFELHFDGWLFLLIVLLISYGLIVLYSASGRDIGAVTSQGLRVAVGIAAMFAMAQLPPSYLRRWAVWAYAGMLVLLVVVLFFDPIKGGRRWIQVPGIMNFQPSELAKLIVPMMVAAYLHERRLPPRPLDVVIAALIVVAPTVLICIEPDLGTGLIVAAAGFSVLLFAGLYWRWVLTMVAAAAAATPLLWLVMKDYQRQRVLMFLDPEIDPLGSGWNTIQAKTAIGSGGVLGKGLFHGTQSHLDFLPEGSTDFIIAVLGEEFGLLGIVLLLSLYLSIIARGLYIVANTRDVFCRIFGGSLVLTFFVYVFVNMAMVSGIAPIVGVPLPMVSYGGTAMITLLVGFGILMSVRAYHPVTAR